MITAVKQRGTFLIARMGSMGHDHFIHDVYVSVNWPIVLGVATALVLIALVAVLWARRRR